MRSQARENARARNSCSGDRRVRYSSKVRQLPRPQPTTSNSARPSDQTSRPQRPATPIVRIEGQTARSSCGSQKEPPTQHGRGRRYSPKGRLPGYGWLKAGRIGPGRRGDQGMPRVITAAEASWILPFTGPAPREFRAVIAVFRRSHRQPAGGTRGLGWIIPCCHGGTIRLTCCPGVHPTVQQAWKSDLNAHGLNRTCPCGSHLATLAADCMGRADSTSIPFGSTPGTTRHGRTDTRCATSVPERAGSQGNPGAQRCASNCRNLWIG